VEEEEDEEEEEEEEEEEVEVLLTMLYSLPVFSTGSLLSFLPFNYYHP